MKTHNLLNLALAGLLAFAAGAADTNTAELKNLSVNGGIEDGKARLVIEAILKGGPGDREKLVFGTSVEEIIRLTREKITYSVAAVLDVLQGEPKELTLTLGGEADVRQVTGAMLQDWSIRQETNGARTLVLRPRKGDKPLTQLAVEITADREMRFWSNPLPILTLTPPQPALLSGYLKIEPSEDFDIVPEKIAGLVPMDLRFLPEPMRSEAKPDEPEPMALRFAGTAYSLALRLSLADPEARRILFRDFKLAGQLADQSAVFTLSTTVRIKNPRGTSVMLLTGNAALADLQTGTDWRMKYVQGQYVLVFDKPGDYPIQVKFNAGVRQSNGWNTVDFRVTPSALQPITLRGLAPDTQFEFPGAARPERQGAEFTSFLPSDGNVRLSWKEARPETEGKLFFSAEMLSQISISPGLMRQVALVEGKVMQGEMTRLTLRVRGEGEITRVQGEQVVSWNAGPAPGSSNRLVTIQFNQPLKDVFAVQVQMQTSLGAFPQAVSAMQLRPEGATRFAGYYRVVNEGAVRLEIVQAGGLSQISPEQFPETDATKALLRATGGQRFAFRFSGAEYALRIQADNVLPELGVSEVLAYRLGETELGIDAEIELDIREAPVRELTLRVPKGFSLARLTASGLSDYFLRAPDDQPDAELRLVYGQPASGRQVIQLRLERNKPLAEAAWVLPKIEVSKAKSTRGSVGVSADAGFRLTPEKTAGLADIATAFFPKKVAGIQAAFRITEAAWQATLRIERLPQTVQVDAFHLFSIGDGIAYGSSLLNYQISGAPVSTFRVELPNDYFNVEFSGRDIRNWQKTTNGYLVQLHTPVAGAFTLLATYERPFKAQGETLAFAGARPLDAQTEQGHTIVVSAYQFQVKPVEVSAGLLALETAEVPQEYRLFFDAPILAAYRYTSRPFNLSLALSRLAQGETLSQVADRAILTTRISKEGQVITDAKYFVKNRGQPNFKLTLPDDTQLWSATVNGVSVVPVTADKANLIPLPQRADPNAVLTIELKLASRSKNAGRLTVAAPIVAAPVLLAEWKIQPDTKQRLVYRQGSLTPVGGVADDSGFAGLTRMFATRGMSSVLRYLGMTVAGFVVALVFWLWAGKEGVYRLSPQHVFGTLFGLAGFVVATFSLLGLGDVAEHSGGFIPKGLSFLAPVQQSGSALSVQLENLPDETTVWTALGRAWPALAALLVWLYAWVTTRQWFRPLGGIAGWTLLAWAALRWPNGAAAFLFVCWLFFAFHVLVPALRRLWKMPARPAAPPPANSGVAPAVTALLLLATASLWAAEAPPVAQTPKWTIPKDPPLAESVVQQVRVEDKFVFASARVHWQAIKGQVLPVLYQPAVLTRLVYPTNTLKAVYTYTGSRFAHALVAQADGTFDIEVQYQVQVSKKDGESGFGLPTQYGLVNRVVLTLADLDVDVIASQSVAVQRETSTTNRTMATLVLSPVNDSWIAWKPRSRDVKREKAVFYAEMVQLYVPAAGVVEGAHLAQIRPAQGELSEIIFDVPGGATVADVIDPTKLASPDGAKNSQTPGTPSSIVSLWRFDPDTRKLRVSLSPAQSKPFLLLIRSQVATGPLPVEQAVGLVAVNNAAGQLGTIGVATGSEVQLDSAVATAFAPINLEDFPAAVIQTLQGQFPGLTLRRAFRYSEPAGTVILKASAVEPDVRVETQETLSLGEDRTLLAANVGVEITRAGIFRLSFALPAGLDVESISGNSLSHWTELKTGADRVITLHLKGKTEGRQEFSISLAGPGARATNNWLVPKLVIREAGKQQGQLVIVPEQGMRLQAGARDGVTQLDPQKAGIRQKGVLAFRLLQNQWKLTLDIEQVDPWIQVTSLQHATVNEAQVKVAASLQYQIENTGLKAFRVLLPTNAESVQFTGEQVADFLTNTAAATGPMREWEVKLHRRVIGRYLLQVTWQDRLPEKAPELLLRGVQAVGVNLQRGYVTVQSGGRLQLRAPNVPPQLQPSEWQSVPRNLRQDMQAASASYTFRLVEAAYVLPISIERHEAAKLLPARITGTTLTSVISDEGVMLTQVRLQMIPGDKRLLHLSLPKDCSFWFAFVNQNGVWPWREEDRILIPLEQQARGAQPIVVEVFYSSRVGRPGGRSLDLALLGPRFDLPLENIEWQVYLNEKWRLKDWTGTLQLTEDKSVALSASVDAQTYLLTEANRMQVKTREAEQMLSLGNTALEKGDPQQARRAFQAAYGLSTHDDAFNEDARVQLHNLKLQQALVGLNVRQAGAVQEGGAVASKLRDLRNRKDVNYTQQEARQIIDANPAEDNAALMRLAERLIQQQDAAVASPTAIRANVPQQGRLLTFSRAVLVDPWAEMKLDLEAKAVRAASWGMRLLILTLTLAGLGLVAWVARGLRRSASDQSGSRFGP